MRKCDSCGKVVVNEQDYMCPHCGAVAKKHCDHTKHLPDDKYNRTNAYNTNNNYNNPTPHKSKTYDYQPAPKTNESQKFDINDLANIKNAEDAKRVAKKAFIEQDANGRKKFKPLAIVLIVIFAVNIFGNLLSAIGDGIGDVFDELEYAFEEMELVDYTLGEDLVVHNFSAYIHLDDAEYDERKDCLTLDISNIYFEYYESHNEDFETVANEWQTEFSFPSEYIYSEDIELGAIFYNEEEISDPASFEDSYEKKVNLKTEITESGEMNIYGLKPYLNELDVQDVYFEIYSLEFGDGNAETNELFVYYFDLPFNFVKISQDDALEFYNGYADETEVKLYEEDFSTAYIPEEYVESIGW